MIYRASLAGLERKEGRRQTLSSTTVGLWTVIESIIAVASSVTTTTSAVIALGPFGVGEWCRSEAWSSGLQVQGKAGWVCSVWKVRQTFVTACLVMRSSYQLPNVEGTF